MPQLEFKTVLRHGEKIIVDNFAGGGGVSEGIRMALNREPDVAINHDEKAIAMHSANHPQTNHYTKDVFEVDPLEATGGNPVGYAWFSPDCKHFSKAKGGKPKSKKIRGLAWVVINWVNKVAPEVIALENVEEFQKWAPLDKEGQVSKWRSGWFYQCFKGALERRGYKVESRELRSMDYGAPTTRKRLIILARRDGKPIVWPDPTHGDPTSEEVKAGVLKPWRIAAECIDWSIPCHSIFLSKEEAKKLRIRRPLAEATCRRIAKGIMKFLVNAVNPFLISYYGEKKKGEFRGNDLFQPIQTQTTENRFALVSAHIAKFRKNTPGTSAAEPLDSITAGGLNHGVAAVHITKFRKGAVGSNLDDPMHTITAGGGNEKRPAGAGHAMGLVSAHLIECANASSNRTFDLKEPLRTICAETKGGHYALIAANVLNMKGQSIGSDAKSPMPTITEIPHLAEVRAFLIKYYGTKKDGCSIDEPLHTVTSKERFALVTIHGQDYVIVDICLRMLSPRELYHAQGFRPDYIIGDEGGFLKLTKADQVRMCGNSVPPPLAEAITRANVPYLAVEEVQKAS